MSSNSGSNRNKALLGFGAIVAVVIVAILLWPSTFRKEDASGAIGAVQKHHAPQITQQDVILGGEQVKAQQKILYTDFLADAGKLRSLAASRSVDGVRQYQSELQMRWMRNARDAANRMTEARLAEADELAMMLAQKAVLSDEEMVAFSRKLDEMAQAESRTTAFARIDAAREEFSRINFAEEALATRQLSDIQEMMSRIDADIDLVAYSRYFDAMEVESRALARATADELQLAADKLAQRAAANEADFAELQSNLAVRLQDFDSFVGTRFTNNAAMMSRSGPLNARVEQLASRMRDRQALAQKLGEAIELDARHKK